MSSLTDITRTNFLTREAINRSLDQAISRSKTLSNLLWKIRKAKDSLLRWFPRPYQGLIAFHPGGVPYQCIPSTSFLKALWCRWTHRGTRTFGLPSSGHHNFWLIHCTCCNARYTVTRQNCPQIDGPWSRRDKTKPKTWAAEWEQSQLARKTGSR